MRSLAAAGDKESGLPDRPNTATPAGHVVGYLRDWKVYHFHDTSESARIKQPGRCDETDSLLPQADNLAAFLRSIRDTDAYRLIVRTIQRVAPFFLDFVLEPERDNPKLIRLRWKHRGSEDTFDASDFSDGTLRFITNPDHRVHAIGHAGQSVLLGGLDCGRPRQRCIPISSSE